MSGPPTDLDTCAWCSARASTSLSLPTFEVPASKDHAADITSRGLPTGQPHCGRVVPDTVLPGGTGPASVPPLPADPAVPDWTASGSGRPYRQCSSCWESYVTYTMARLASETVAAIFRVIETETLVVAQP